MAFKHNDRCIEIARPEERLFVLMARDETAPEVTMEWIKLNLRKQPKEKLLEAFHGALEMIDTRDDIIISNTKDKKIKSLVDKISDVYNDKSLKI